MQTEPMNLSFEVLPQTVIRSNEIYNSEAFINLFAKGIKLFCLPGVIGVDSLLSLTIEVYDELSEEWHDLHAAVLVDVGSSETAFFIIVYPESITDAATAVIRQHLGRKWRVRVSINDEGDSAMLIHGTYLV